jgi:Protein of unknown function (DUF3015)
MKQTYLATIITFLSLVGANNVYAVDGSSGCGPAWYVFKENTILSSAIRNTTNGFLSPVVTLGMTFGTSNCAQHKLVQNDKRGIHFVTHNTYNLASDASIGRGETLGALAETMHCDWTSQAHFDESMKHNFDEIFGVQEQPGEVLYGHIVNVIARDPELASSCFNSAS